MFSILSYLLEYNIIIYIPCGFAIPAKNLQHYLRDYHAISDITIQQEIITSLLFLDLQPKQDYQDFTPLELNIL